VPLQVTAIMLGVQDLNRSKKFYGEGLGCTIDQDHPTFVSFNLGDGSSSLALYQWEAAAHDAGVSPEGSGFRGVSFHFIVPRGKLWTRSWARPWLPVAASSRKQQCRRLGTSGTSATQTATSGRSPLAPEQLAAVPRKRHDWHGEWSYTVPPTAT
jgi:catechol 2,3-dioxygenase-like lactoylglutathione lyase family enzyme